MLSATLQFFITVDITREITLTFLLDILAMRGGYIFIGLNRPNDYVRNRVSLPEGYSRRAKALSRIVKRLGASRAGLPFR
jgi:hypothetical protein